MGDAFDVAVQVGDDLTGTLFDVVVLEEGSTRSRSIPRSNEPVQRTGLITQLTEPLQFGLAEQELGYECRDPGTTVLGLRVSFPGGGDLW